MMSGYEMSWVGWLFMVSFWVVLLAGVVVLIRSFAERPAASEGSSARRVLDERFASGELSIEEYQERRRLLH